MPATRDKPNELKFTTSESAALKALARLIDQLPGFLCLSDFDQLATYHNLGLTAEQIGFVTDLFKIKGVREEVEVKDLPLAPPEHCPLNWRPAILTPVFYGRQIFEPNNCLPATTRVYYPSLDGSPQNAALLDLCGGFPLILFLHGHCSSEDNHVYRWDRTLSQLARCGFVVVAPYMPSIGSGPQNDETFQMALKALRWIRNHWSGRSILLHATGVCGHSYGAMVAGRVAVSERLSAYAAMSAGWHEWLTYGPAPLPLFNLTMPSCHIWGTEGSPTVPDAISDADFSRIATPRHKVVLNGGEHWVYLQGQTGGCSPSAGGCHLLGAIAGDLLAGFFAHYLPPSERTLAGAAIPLSLVAPKINLSFDQQFYAGGHLSGLAGLPYSIGCKIDSVWATNSSTGQLVLNGN